MATINLKSSFESLTQRRREAEIAEFFKNLQKMKNKRRGILKFIFTQLVDVKAHRIKEYNLLKLCALRSSA